MTTTVDKNGNSDLDLQKCPICNSKTVKVNFSFERVDTKPLKVGSSLTMNISAECSICAWILDNDNMDNIDWIQKND